MLRFFYLIPDINSISRGVSFTGDIVSFRNDFSLQLLVRLSIIHLSFSTFKKTNLCSKRASLFIMLKVIEINPLGVIAMCFFNPHVLLKLFSADIHFYILSQEYN